MSRRIFRDVEEALSREVRRITFHNSRTLDQVVLKDTFDPFTGEIVELPIEANYYDSSADTNAIQYPHFFIRLLKSREDRFSGRVVPQYGKWIECPVATSPKAFEIIVSGSDGIISATGNEFKTTLFNIRKVQVGYLLRLLNGNNKGTYKVDSITVSNSGLHSIFVSNDLIENLPTSNFNPTSRELIFTNAVDLSTIVVGDNFVDSAMASFPITAININASSITLGGVGNPSTATDGKISRTGDVFQNTDPSLVRFIVMDPSKPVLGLGLQGPDQAYTSNSGVSPAVPLDTYYLIRIDSKERDTHIDVLNRVWEEFNPPRTALPVIKRSALSADSLLTADVTTGGSNVVNVADNSKYNVNDTVFIFDDFLPSKRTDGEGFQRPFESKVTALISNNQIQLADVVPDTFIVANNARIVSNAEFYLYMFHFVDHVTKDVEGSQYWVHEFVFWVQIWVDRLELPKTLSVIQDISTPIEDINGNIIIDDP